MKSLLLVKANWESASTVALRGCNGDSFRDWVDRQLSVLKMMGLAKTEEDYFFPVSRASRELRALRITLPHDSLSCMWVHPAQTEDGLPLLVGPIAPFVAVPDQISERFERTSRAVRAALEERLYIPERQTSWLTLPGQSHYEKIDAPIDDRTEP